MNGVGTENEWVDRCMYVWSEKLVVEWISGMMVQVYKMDGYMDGVDKINEFLGRLIDG